MFCPKCGKNLPDGARFCNSCGAGIPAEPVSAEQPKLAAPVPPPAAPAAPPKKKRWIPLLWIAAIVLLVAAVVGLALMLIRDLGIGSGNDDPARPSASAAADPDETPGLPEVALDQAAITLYAGDELTLAATGGDGAYGWHSSSPAIASVENGTITAKAKGRTTITVTSGGKTASCTVTVQEYTLTLDQSSLSMFAGDRTNLTLSGAPAGAKIAWTSSDSTVATASDGSVTALSAGSAHITASFVNGSKTYTAKCQVTVVDAGITLSPGSSTLYLGDTLSLTAETKPGGAEITWSSSDASVATVSGGTVTAKGAGTATITASFIYHEITYSASCSVTVTRPSISLSQSSGSLYVGDTLSLSASTTPGGQSVSWSSSNTSVATVSGGGTVTATGSGSATITASFTYNGATYSASCSVTVTRPSVSLSRSSISSFYVGDMDTLSATTYPGGQSVSWSSSNTSVATVSGGTVTAKGSGSASITAQFTYKGTTYSTTCSVTVTRPSISLSRSSIDSLYAGDTYTLSATTYPGGQSVSWKTSDSSVATVSNGGTVTATGSGSATITASFTYKGTAYSTTCSVTVEKPSVSLSRSSVSSLCVGDTYTLSATTYPSGQSVSWSSSNTSVASVNSSGKVTAKGKGSATITAKFTYRGTTYSTTCSVTVSSEPSISLSQSSIGSFYVGDTYTLSTTVKPSGQSVSWSSSDSSVASVSSSGRVTAKGAGSATITASFSYGGTTYSARCSVTVTQPGVALSYVSASESRDVWDDSYSSTLYNKPFWPVDLPTVTVTPSYMSYSWTVIQGDAWVSGKELRVTQPGTIVVRASMTYNGATYFKDYTHTIRFYKTTTATNILRTGPGLSYSTAGTVPANTTVEITQIGWDGTLGQTGASIWGKTTYKGKTCWIIISLWE